MRISISGLLLATALCSLICAIMFAVPDPWGLWILAALTYSTLPSLLLTGCLFSYAHVRACFLGATFGIGLPVLCSVPYFFSIIVEASDFSNNDASTILAIKGAIACIWLFACASGVFSWRLYCWLRPHEFSNREHEGTVACEGDDAWAATSSHAGSVVLESSQTDEGEPS